MESNAKSHSALHALQPTPDLTKFQTEVMTSTALHVCVRAIANLVYVSENKSDKVPVYQED
jgi:hypothetical protein